MEVESDGQSDLSGSWCIVESDVAVRKDYNSSDSGVTSQSSSVEHLTTQVKTDDCYEMTEMYSSNELINKNIETDETGRNMDEPTGYIESDIDTDGISVISDEECSSWRQSAHDNYHTLLQEFTDPTSTSRKATNTSNESSSFDANETIVATRDMNLNVAVNDNFEGDTAHFSSTYIFTTSILVGVLGYIAIQLFSGVEFTTDRVADIMEALDRLKAENDALRMELAHISNAYSILEEKISKNEFSQTQPDKIASDWPTTTEFGKSENKAEGVLLELISHAHGIANHQLQNDAETLLTTIKQSSSKFRSEKLESRIVTLSRKIISRPCDKLQRQFSDLVGRIKSKRPPNQNSVDKNDLNIVQWYPHTINEASDKSEGRFPVDSIRENGSDSKPIKVNEAYKNYVDNKSGRIDKDKLKQNFKANPKFYNNNLKTSKHNLKVAKRSKDFNNAFNKSSKWFHARYKERETARNENKRGDWQFDRARDRREHRNLGEKLSGYWYFKANNLYT